MVWQNKWIAGVFSVFWLCVLLLGAPTRSDTECYSTMVSTQLAHLGSTIIVSPFPENSISTLRSEPAFVLLICFLFFFPSLSSLLSVTSSRPLPLALSPHMLFSPHHLPLCNVLLFVVLPRLLLRCNCHENGFW